MKIILPILPKTVYLVDFKRVRASVTSKIQSYLSYLSYLTFFVHFSIKKAVDNSAILSIPPDPYKEIYFYKIQRNLGKIATKVRWTPASYPSPNSLTHRDKLAV
jgi:hypothetical protein